MRLRLALLMAAAGPAAARVVDYTALNANNFAAEAAKLKVEPVTAPPSRSNREIISSIAGGVDHEVLTLGNYCSAYKVGNPMAPMLKALFAEASRDPAIQATAETLKITVATARSNQRCVELKEYNVRCIARVTLTGTGEVGGTDVSAQCQHRTRQFGWRFLRGSRPRSRHHRPGSGPAVSRCRACCGRRSSRAFSLIGFLICLKVRRGLLAVTGCRQHWTVARFSLGAFERLAFHLACY